MAAVVLLGATIIDGSGAEPISGGVVRLEDGKIAAVGAASQLGDGVLAGAEVLDVRGHSVLPGLVNCHEHLDLHYSYGSWEHRVTQSSFYWVARAPRNALLALSQGVTTVRDVGCRDGSNLEMKKAIEDGLILGPRVLASGPALAVTGGHGWHLSIMADGPDAVRKAVRQIIHAGADFLKCFGSGDFMIQNRNPAQFAHFSADEMRAAFDEAHNAGKLVTAHCQPPVAIQRAVEAGVDSIEHGALLDERSAELMAKRGVAIIPTLGETLVIAERGETLGKPKWLIETCRAESENRIRSFCYAVDGGVKIAVGTDTCDTMADEMELMLRAGMSPMDIIIAATRTGAEVCGLADLTGTIEMGKSADVIVVPGNPLEDMSALSRVAMVFKEGMLYRPDELRPAIGRYPL